MDQKALVKYLATGEAPAPSVAVLVEERKGDPIFEVATNLLSVGMLAKDLHYRARGKAFYAIHLLADLVWESRREVDELLEVYYLGEMRTVPPLMCHFERSAAEKAGKTLLHANAPGDNRSFSEDQILQALVNRCEAVAGCVEWAKSLALRSGTNAVLDEISKKALQNAGLLTRTDPTATTEPAEPAAVSET